MQHGKFMYTVLWSNAQPLIYIFTGDISEMYMNNAW